MTSSRDGNATPITDIHDIKPLLSMGPDLQWLYWALAALGLAGLALLAWYLWRRRKKPVPSIPAPPPAAPHIEAIRALDALAAQTDISGKPYYFALSAILRRYLERRYGFPAVEMTTEELLPRLDGLPLDADLAPALKAFCRAADPIKFAGADAARSQMNDHMAMARSFVKRTTLEQGVASEDFPKNKPGNLLPVGTRTVPIEQGSSAVKET
jgi:LPXTG-motif cell wall-anchored protein